MDSTRNPKILILYGTYGDGHLQAANALQEATRLRHPEAETVLVDMMEWIHPYVHTVSRYLFMQGVKKFPSLYGYIFHKTRHSKSSLVLKSYYLLILRRLLKLVEETEPTVVVSTFPLAAATMSMLKAYGWTCVPVVTVITDHTDHSYWIHPCTDRYIVGSNQVREALLQSGIEDARIFVTGIPVRPEFSQTYDREALLDKYRLDPALPVVLVMGGGYGLISDGVSILHSLEKVPQTMQLIVVCGRNRKLLKELRKAGHASKHRMMLRGYVHYVHELMAVSHVMITKPGGLTTAEAIAQELPMIFYKPLPGQEQDNARFLLRSGVAVQADSQEDVANQLNLLFAHPEKLAAMREKARHLQSKWAAFDALEVILRLQPTGRQRWMDVYPYS